jgi:chromosome partitioning protein
MTVVALLGRKGGSGKSTLSTNMAAWCARNGHQVMLGDVDRQQSVRSWLQRRSPQAAKVNTWAVDNGKVFRAPPGTTHVILDTPGGLYDHELAKLVVWVDAVVVPIGPSVFDRDASLDFLKELHKLPKVASGRCKVAVVGMRWPLERVQQWHAQGKQWDTPLLTVIPDMAHYRSCLENGGSLFDMPDAIRQSDMPHWQPLLDWLDGVWKPAAATTNNTLMSQRFDTVAEQMRSRPTVTSTATATRIPSRPIAAPVAARQIIPAQSTVSSAMPPAAPSSDKAWVPKWLRIA